MNNQSRKPKLGCQQMDFCSYDFVPNKTTGICLFGFVSVSCLVLGSILIFFSNQIIEYRESYDCGLSTCEIELEINEKVNGPVYFYYEIDGYFQNHRKYAKSRNLEQLKGNYLSESELTTCSPIIKMKDLEIDIQLGYATNLDDDDAAMPCGLIASSLFNDTFSIEGIDISEKNIA